MVAVTRNTIGDTGIVYIRDVLKNSLADTQSPARTGSNWIFKSTPEKLEISYPYVIVDSAEDTKTKLTLSGTKFDSIDYLIDIIVWANKIQDRDVVGDNIVRILSNPDSTDGTTTIKNKGFWYQKATKSNDDFYVGGKPDIIRVKKIRASFRYNGA